MELKLKIFRDLFIFIVVGIDLYQHPNKVTVILYVLLLITDAIYYTLVIRRKVRDKKYVGED